MFDSFKNKLKTFFKKEEVEEEKPQNKDISEESEKKKIDKDISEKDKAIKKEKGSKKQKDIEKQVEEKIIEIPKPKKKKEKTEKIIPEKEDIKEENKEEIEYLIDKVEEKIEEDKTEVLEKKSEGFFSSFKKKLTTTTLKKEHFDEFFEQLENLMLENNVALEVVDKIREDMEKDLIDVEVKKSEIEEEIKNSLKKSIEDILTEPFDLIEKIKEKEGVFSILFFGINGSGKTTTIAKVASMLNKNKIPCVMAAGDTFRAASIEQLKKHGDNLGVKVINQNYGADPAAVAFDAIKYAKAHGVKVVLIDTAGRMHTKSDLIREMEKIIRVTKPDMKIFVAESITGNDAVEQAKTFNESFGIDATILTKADVDEKGGTAVSISYVSGKPILFLGTGQEYDALTKFSSKEIITNLGLE